MKISEEEIQNRLLLKRAIEKNCSDAFERIYQKYHGFVANYIAAKIRFKNESDDLVQIVFMRIFQSKCKYKGNSDVRGYLCGIANNVVHNHLRKKKRELKTSSLEEIKITGNLLIGYCKKSDPLHPIQNEEIKQTLKESIASLSPKSRQAVELVYYQGLSPCDAAQKIGCNFGVFRGRLNLGRKLLRSKLQVYLKNIGL